MEVGGHDREGRARCGVAEPFGSGAGEEFLESGATTGSKNDEIGIEFLDFVENAFVRVECDDLFGRWS